MLPGFAVALPQDALLQSSPPFDYPGVQMRIFPLRADMTRVQSLVDGWLNSILPPDIAYFRVFSPFVTLVALHYGRAAVIPSNLGWSSQREVTFSIPLQWFRRTRRGFELVDVAALTPFIFVDNDLSVPAGREVFGWQKTLISMDSLGDRWLTSPRAPVKHAGMSTRAFREIYAGNQAEPMPFVAIDEAPSGAALQYPPDKLNPLLPWVALNNAMGAAADLTQDILNLMIGIGLTRRRDIALGNGERHWLDAPGSGSVARTIQTLLRSVDPYSPDLRFNEINLKQFRDAARPTTACYQDVNCTVMRIREINQMGLLGETRALVGDITGGYRVTLHQWESLPIADMLGLVSKRSTDVDGATVVSLKPVLPMWADLDLSYADERRVIAWRSKDHPWSTGPSRGTRADRLSGPRDVRLSGPRDVRQSGPRDVRPSGPRAEEPPQEEAIEIPYNTTLGSSSPVIYGPFESPESTLRVLPLLASRRKLARLCDKALNGPLRDMAGDAPGARAGAAPGYSFEPWGSYVYLVVNTCDKTYSVDNNIGSWATQLLSFVVPVRRFLDGAPDGFALFSPFMFSAGALDAMSASEINGMRVINAAIDSPSSTWLEARGPAVGRSRDLCVLRAMIPPILDAGERARMRTVLKISQRSPDGLIGAGEQLDRHWGPRIKRDLEQRRGAVPQRNGNRAHPGAPDLAESLRVARAHAIDLLADQGAFPFVALKQFRDVARPDRACYQALVEVDSRLLHVDSLEEITTPLEVTIFDHRSLQIADVLGLRPRSGGYHKGHRFQRFEPIRPFWGTGMLREELGRNLAEHQRDTVWVRRAEEEYEEPEREAPENDESDSVSAAMSEAERLAHLRAIDLGKPRALQQMLSTARGKSDSGAAAPEEQAPGATGRPAAEAIAAIEPQWVIESLLSREWESRTSPRWLHERRRIERAAALARDISQPFTVRAFDEIKVLTEELRAAAGGPHQDIVEIIQTQLLPRFVGLSWISAEAQHLNELEEGQRAARTGELPHGAGAGRPLVNAEAAAQIGLHFADGEEEEASERSPVHDRIQDAPNKNRKTFDSGPEGVESLYRDSGFEVLEKKEPELVRQAEAVIAHDVPLGGLLKKVIALCGDAASGVIHDYAGKHPEAAAGGKDGAVPDVLLHFGAEDDEDDDEPSPREVLPPGLADELEQQTTTTLATARALVYLAWKTAAADPAGKRAQWKKLLEESRTQVEEARKALILALAKCSQKPFFLLRRDTAGTAELAAELFPAQDCRSDREDVSWYWLPAAEAPSQ